MKILVQSRQSFSLLAVSVGSLVLFVNIVFLFVNYNHHGSKLTINEYLDAVNGNQTKYLTKWHRISEQGRDMLIPDSSRNGSSKLRNCDLYHGKWIYDATGPLYTNNTCPILTQSQNCKGNGRPEKNYENWRWKPNQCKLALFDGRKFLKLMTGKTLAFVGDSLARNQMESLLCMLWQTEVPKRVRHKWYFKSTSTAIARIWSAWLVHSTPLAIPSSSSPRAVNVHLETPDKSLMDFLHNCDVVVLDSGHWFNIEPNYVLNGTIIRRQLRRTKKSRKKQKVDSSQGTAKQKTDVTKSDGIAKHKADNIKSNGAAKQKADIIKSYGKTKQKIAKKQNGAKHQTDIIESYGIALRTVMNAIVNLPNYSGLVVFRSYSPDHYEGGTWNTGGSCAGFDGPSSNWTRTEHETAMAMKQAEVVEGAMKRVSNGCKLRFMDISEVSGYRHDGHPGPYFTRDDDNRKGTEDCVHWCMPGPVDTWNEILFEILLRET